MNKEEVAAMIEGRYAEGSNLSVTRVICKDDVTYYGYFNYFNDYSNSWRKTVTGLFPGIVLKLSERTIVKRENTIQPTALS